jgi:valyl-tRNA synthetase
MGADAVRWGLLVMSSGQDVRFSEEKVAQGLQLTNKLWNASRLILLRIDPSARPAVNPVTVEDRWILSRLERARLEIGERIEGYDFSHAALALYDFVYGELCDWYLELVKPRLYTGDLAAAQTLLHVLTETLALAHPMIPFVTEEIYSYIPGAEGLLAARANPSVGTVDEAAEEVLARTIKAVQALRAWRDFAGVKAGAQISAQLAAEGYQDTAGQIARLARLTLSEDGAVTAPQPAPSVASVLIPGGTVEILPGDGLDVSAAERKRERRRQELEAEIERAERKLANDGFLAKAPPRVVQAEREKLERLQAELESL